MMGCLLCNITACKEFEQGDAPPIVNPFYCKTRKRTREFLDELAYDIASKHPEMVRRINRYVRRLWKLKGGAGVKDHAKSS
jgi:hypothetical protein